MRIWTSVLVYSGHHKQNMLTNEIVATTSITLTKGEAEEDVTMVGDDRAEQRVFGRTIIVKRLSDEKVEIVWGAD